MNTVIYKQQTTLPLYVSPSHSQQGLTTNDSGKMLPIELSEGYIKRELCNIGNEHAQNEKFIRNCSRFAKFLFEKQCNDFDNAPYQPLDSRILKSKLGKNSDRLPNYYLYVIESLKEIGLVEVNEQFKYTKDGTGNCKGYRINLKYPDRYEVSTTEDLFLVENKRIDDINYLNELKRLKLDEMKFIFLANFLPHDEKQRAFYIYNNWIHRSHFVTVDIYGRIHSLLTILDKRLRCCFTIDDGKQIKEWDIHACMPFLYLGIVLEHVNFRKAKKLSLAELVASNHEIGTYVRWIQNGRFYIELYRAFKELKGDPKSSEVVKALKKSFFKNMLFSDTPAKDKELKIHKIFADLFPFINQSLIKFKRKEGHKAVAQTLQSLESELMNLTIERLRKNDPSRLYLRFHDAVLTDDLDYAKVEAIMVETICDLYGIHGQVKFNEYWGASFDSVARNLKLHVYSTYLSYKRDRYIGKQKSALIGKAVSNVSKEFKSVAVSQAIKNWNENRLNEHKSIEATRNFMSPKLCLPSHWNPKTVDQFKAFALKTINDVFSELESKHTGDILNIIQKNKELVILMVNK